MKPEVWNQIKNITADKLIACLEKDKWEKRSGRGSRLIFIKERCLHKTIMRIIRKLAVVLGVDPHQIEFSVVV